MSDGKWTEATGLLPSVETRVAISDVLTKYCTLMDRGEFEAMAEQVFTDDVIESHGEGFPDARGRDGVAVQFGRLMAPFEGFMHIIANIRFEPGPDDAVRTWTYFLAFHWFVESGPDPLRPADMITTGVYEDVFVLTAEGWRIKNRKRRNVGPSPLAVGRLPSAVDFSGLGGPSSNT